MPKSIHLSGTDQSSGARSFRVPLLKTKHILASDLPNCEGWASNEIGERLAARAVSPQRVAPPPIGIAKNFALCVRRSGTRGDVEISELLDRPAFDRYTGIPLQKWDRRLDCPQVTGDDNDRRPCRNEICYSLRLARASFCDWNGCRIPGSSAGICRALGVPNYENPTVLFAAA
jgi:hypothetical protein